MRSIKIFTLSVIAAGALVGNVQAQQPTPPLVIVQPANAAPAVKAAPAQASTADTALLATAIKAL